MTPELAILTALNRVHPRLLPETAVRGDAGCLLGTAVTIADCRLALAGLEAAGEVTGISNKDLGIRWKITDAGRARLAEAQA